MKFDSQSWHHVSDQFENIDWEALWAKHHTNHFSHVGTRVPLSEAWKSSLWSHWVWETKRVWTPSPYALTHCFSSYAPIRNNPRAMSQSLLLRTVWQRKRRGLLETGMSIFILSLEGHDLEKGAGAYHLFRDLHQQRPSLALINATWYVRCMECTEAWDTVSALRGLE